MKKPLNEEKILRAYIRNIIAETLLTEKFASPSLSKFVAKVKTAAPNISATLRQLGIAWDQIPEDAVTIDQSGSATIKAAVNDKTKIIIWVSPAKQQTVVSKPTTYTRYGAKRDNSIYLRPGRVLITQGKNFLYGYDNLMAMSPATQRYEKPLDGALSVTKLATELEADALVLVRAYDYEMVSKGIKSARSSAKSGATALMTNAQALEKNQAKYREIVRKNKAKSYTKEVDERVEKAIEEVKKRIESASMMTVQNLISFSKTDRYGATPEKPLTQTRVDLNRVNFDELAKATRLYNEIVDSYTRYIREANDSVRNPSITNYQKWAEDRKTELYKLLDQNAL